MQNAGTLVIGLLLAILVGSILTAMIKRHKKGERTCGCGGSCGTCGACSLADLQGRMDEDYPSTDERTKREEKGSVC